MEISLKNNTKVNNIDIDLLHVYNNEYDYQYHEKMINMINFIIIKFNETDDFKCKIYQMNKLYAIIYAKQN